MTLKIYLSGIIFTTALALVSFLLILEFFPPESADAFLLGLLFFSLFVGLVGIFSLSGFYVRKRKHVGLHPFKFLGISFRQGTLLSLLLVGTLFLRAFMSYYWWWGSMILLIMIIAIEFFFLRSQE